MATYRKEKAVLVAVYVETPRRRRLSSNNHHHHHLYVHQPKDGANGGGGYNRRAQLLDYSRRLRESARSGPSMPLLPKPAPSNNQQPMKQITKVRSKPKKVKDAACLGNLKIVIPGFLRSLITPQTKTKKKKKKRVGESTTTKLKFVMKSFQVKKKDGFISKLLAGLKKRR